MSAFSASTTRPILGRIEAIHVELEPKIGHCVTRSAWKSLILHMFWKFKRRNPPDNG